MTAGSAHLVDFYQQLRRSWSIETSSGWQPGNPASGQCGVTALVVHDKLGGEILKTDVNGAWHFYNRHRWKARRLHDESIRQPHWLR